MKSVVVLEALRHGCTDYGSIIKYANEKGVSISEKTVRRHIKLLNTLEYKVIGENGIFSVQSPKSLARIKLDITESTFGSAAYPIMILTVLEKSEHPIKQREIIYSIKWTFNARINRKAVSRLIKGLIKLGYNIEHTREGYIFNQS